MAVQLYGVPHGNLRVFINLLYENVFQNASQVRFSLEHSTLAPVSEVGGGPILPFKKGHGRHS
jgi:hypothetical protein